MQAGGNRIPSACAAVRESWKVSAEAESVFLITNRKEAGMGEHRKIIFCLCLLLVCAACAADANTDQGRRGKFYIVGMGTAPDLITIRGAEVIKSADIVLVGNEQEREMWKEHNRNKEVWYCPDSIRIKFGLDPRTIADPQTRAAA